MPTTTPLKLADYFNISSGVYTLDGWPSLYSVEESMPMFEPTLATAVVTGPYKAFVEIIFENTEATLQSWHLDGYAFWVVGYVTHLLSKNILPLTWHFWTFFLGLKLDDTST